MALPLGFTPLEAENKKQMMKTQEWFLDDLLPVLGPDLSYYLS